MLSLQTSLTQSGYPLKLYFQIHCVFPVQPQIFPVPTYVFCDYYIHKIDLADLSSFCKKNGTFVETIAIFFTFTALESGNLQLEQTKFPVFWQNFQIPCALPNKYFFGHFPCAVGTLTVNELLFNHVSKLFL